MRLYNSISNLIACLNKAVKSKKRIVSIRLTKQNKQIISLLYNEGYISSYKYLLYINKNKMSILVRIVLRYYNNNPVLHNIKHISKPGHKKFYNLNTIRRNYRFNNIGCDYVYSTNRGILTGTECLNYGIGGIPLFIIN
jgi:small subunit ribosomal protein S8